ncbi:P-loop containing nucleoside triphosphate hydrolase protein [Tuber indicum]|nr:P-loop containing nucleoside triphosphate hydrolase protein [Tuber indicum]
MAEHRVSLKSRMGKKSKALVGTAITTHKPSASAPPPTAGASGIDKPKYKVALKFSDIQGDHNSVFYSVKAFEDLGLSKELLEGIYFMNFKRPSVIQERALPLLLSDSPKNLIGQSQSGTGKTAAFVLTMLTRVDMSVSNVQALCLAPTRELARQILGVVQTMGQFTNIKTQLAIPNMVRRGQRIDAHIVVGTPGTVLDLIRRKELAVEHLKILVLDEADNMLDLQGLGEQCLRVKRNVPSITQIALFSATVPDEVVKYANRFAQNANHISLRHEELTLDGIKQLCMYCDSEEDKYRVLIHLYHILTIGSSVIFVQKRKTAYEIQRRMEADGHKVATLHGAEEGPDRDKVVNAFRSGKAKVLITTDVLARGIDVATVSMVVNYDLPRGRDRRLDTITYLHRIGRTGRFGRVGVAITLAHGKQSLSEVGEISNHFGVCITRVPTNDIEEVEKIVNDALKNRKDGRTKR